MREYLFRGKRKGDKEWQFGHLHIIEWDKPAKAKGDYIDYRILGRHNECSYVDPETVGQYTGKTVKNGRVFDGDIGKSIDGIFLVCWDEEKAAFIMRFLEYPFETLYLEEMWDDAEVIGNIHDNPEMLKEGGEE